MSFASYDNSFTHPHEIYVALIFPMHDVHDTFGMPHGPPRDVSLLTSWFLSSPGHGAELTTFTWSRWLEIASSRYLQHLLQYAYYDSFKLDDSIDDFTALLQVHIRKDRLAALGGGIDISDTDYASSTLVGPSTQAEKSEDRTENFKPITHLAHVLIIPISPGYVENPHPSQSPERHLVWFRWASASARDGEIVESSVWKHNLHEALVDGWRKNVCYKHKCANEILCSFFPDLP